MKRLLLLLAAALAPLSASAGEIVLSRPLEAASLHENRLDMSVYFSEDRAGGYVVVATYAPKAAPDQAGRVTMRLDEGDAVHFGLPGQSGAIYGFARSGGKVAVTVAPTLADIPHAGSGY
jgi:hypothetical protein